LEEKKLNNGQIKGKAVPAEDWEFKNQIEKNTGNKKVGNRDLGDGKVDKEKVDKEKLEKRRDKNGRVGDGKVENREVGKEKREDGEIGEGQNGNKKKGNRKGEKENLKNKNFKKRDIKHNSSIEKAVQDFSILKPGQNSLKLSEICNFLGLTPPPEEREIVGLQTLEEATIHHLSFFHNSKYLNQLKKTKAGAVLLPPDYISQLPEGVIPLVTTNPYLNLAQLSALFTPPPFEEGKFYLAPTAQIGKGVIIGKGAKIGQNVVIMGNCVIGPEVEIGDGTLIYPNVTIYRGTVIGKRVIIHAGAVIGADGFGYAYTSDHKPVKIHHLGRVVIGDECEIGANTTIDRGVLGDTRLGQGVKIDNLVQIGHNCQIGDYCIIVAQTGLAGSTKLGVHVVMAGQSASAGHLEIAPFTRIAAKSGVTKSIKKGGDYSGVPARPIREWRRLNAILSRLLKEKGIKKGK